MGLAGCNFLGMICYLIRFILVVLTVIYALTSVVAPSLEESTGLAFRFIIGKTSDKAKMLELKKEVAEYDDFLLLDIEEEYSKLPYKTLV